eukprot:Phypoly_transcript_03646.p1 GENE.Phypoly_transcript_03646~~Phypoly_transcript_03646.p1  ORF type:complete len:709 (+),score=64.53 Phypoly_transcript_03646:245-2371(+)
MATNDLVSIISKCIAEEYVGGAITALASQAVKSLADLTGMTKEDLESAIRATLPGLHNKLRDALTPHTYVPIPYKANTGHFLSTLGAKWTYQHSPDVDEKLKTTLPKHYKKWKAGKPDKQNHPLYLVFAAPGTGKSRLLEEFPALCVNAVQGVHDLQAQISGTQVVLKISFENGTPYTMRLNATAEEELGLRIAYNFIGQDKTFGGFVVGIVNKSDFDIYSVIDRVVASTKQQLSQVTVFLLVDGVHVLPTHLLTDVVKIVGGLVNKAPFFVIGAIAGTYLTPVDKILHASPQRCVYLTPTLVQATDKMVDSRGDETIELVKSDVNGHGRAIEVLVEELKGMERTPNRYTVSEFMAQVRSSLNTRYPALQYIQAPHIRAALLHVFTGVPVTLTTALVGSYTVEDVIQVGLFSLVPRPNGQQQLHCPYILLWLLAKQSGIPELEQIDFCTYGEQLGEAGKNQWQHWQLFVHRFHVIRSHILPPGPLLASEMHRGATQSTDLATLWLTSRPCKLVEASQQLPTKSGSPQQFQYAGGIASTDDCSIFIHNGESAPAGDGFGAVCRQDSTIIHKVFQDKCYKTTISRKDFDTEYKKAVTEGVDIFVFFTSGGLQSDFFTKPLPPLSAIVSKAQFKDYFGIFAGRAFLHAKVNINKATRAQLQEIPQIGPKSADKILKARENGNFIDRTDFETRTGLQNTIKRQFSAFVLFDE